jgi:mono/diheme cytochrome c family protein
MNLRLAHPVSCCLRRGSFLRGLQLRARQTRSRSGSRPSRPAPRLPYPLRTELRRLPRRQRQQRRSHLARQSRLSCRCRCRQYPTSHRPRHSRNRHASLRPLRRRHVDRPANRNPLPADGRALGQSTALNGVALPAYASSAPGDPARGQQAFTLFCARCHGADATGGHADNGTTTGSLVDPAYLALISDQGLRSILIAGQPEQGMPDWRHHLAGPAARPITGQEIADLVAWLTSHRIATPGQPYQSHP